MNVALTQKVMRVREVSPELHYTEEDYGHSEKRSNFFRFHIEFRIDILCDKTKLRKTKSRHIKQSSENTKCLDFFFLGYLRLLALTNDSSVKQRLKFHFKIGFRNKKKQVEVRICLTRK